MKYIKIRIRSEAAPTRSHCHIVLKRCSSTSRILGRGQVRSRLRSQKMRLRALESHPGWQGRIARAHEWGADANQNNTHRPAIGLTHSRGSEKCASAFVFRCLIILSCIQLLLKGRSRHSIEREAVLKLCIFHRNILKQNSFLWLPCGANIGVLQVNWPISTASKLKSEIHRGCGAFCSFSPARRVPVSKEATSWPRA